MSAFEKLSLLSYLNGEEELLKMDQNKDVSVSSVEALALLAGLSFHERKRKMFFLFPSIYEAERFLQFLGDYVEEDETYMFPYDEIFRTSAIGASPEMNEERLLALSSVISSKPSILVSHASASMLNIIDKRTYTSQLITLRNEDMFSLSSLIEKITNLGYLSVDRVSGSGQYSLRGCILDIYDPSYSDPLRIEFFGDEIDDIRMFKVNDERSYNHLREAVIHPASLRLLTKAQIEEGENRIAEELKEMEANISRLNYDDLSERTARLIQKVRRGYLDEIDARFYPLFSKEQNTLLSYLEDYDCYVFEAKETISQAKNALKKEKEYFSSSYKEGTSLSSERVFVESPLNLSTFSLAKRDVDQGFFVRDNSLHAISYAESHLMLKEYLKEGYKVRIILPEPNLSNYINFLEQKEIAYSKYPKHSQVMLLEGRITHGFEVVKEKHVYLSAKEIYGVSDQKSRFLSRYKEAKIIRKYEDLQEGDYVVHEIHGVGKYLGVKTLDGLEYLQIQYVGDQVLYLPLSQYKLIRKYASREGYAPSLDKMGGSTWSRKKSRIRSKISFLADQLLMLYSERKTRPGFSFMKEPELEKDFMDAFAYPYTQGQLDAIRDVMTDMESSSPMDRLIAGDVGFGKTEIGFIAAYKAILSHKQAVLLCPTTILSNQHYKSALARFKGLGVNIEVYNRFVSKSKQEEIKEGLKDGSVDFVIGTHALLSDSIVFHDLGLLIVDEEQKFGVTHKEKIKEKTKNVDCLTLTATPIPRTMQMSLLGVRSMSLLSQAPINRMPVKTYVAKQDKELIYEVIDKELERHGQVYYLHNKISSIFAVRDRLQKKFADAKVGVVHARMTQDEIEDVMDQFYENEIQILVCTSIIESGLDIPNVNTIIVEDADHFGLAQLYQIKGRVGRSNRLAYAYFFFRDSSRLTDEARKRLKALEDFTELGSGYKIAMQDLNIRGAGDILGSEQAGFVDSLGYDAYLELLEEVIKEKTISTSAVLDKNKPNFELSFSLDAHIPEEYGTKEQRITMYRELSDCNNDTSIQEFSEKLRDVYGPYPEEVAALLLKKKIENELNNGTVDRFVEGLGVYTITMSKNYSNTPNLYKALETLLEPLFVKLRVRISNHCFEFILTKTKQYLTDLLFLMEQLKKAYADTVNHAEIKR